MKTGTANPQPYRILVVDDDQTEREILVELLSSPSRSVEAFETSEGALEFLQHNPVDLAFLDHVMPGMKGAELAEKIKLLAPQTRVVMCTGYLIEVGHSKVCAQVERVMHKPLNLGEVLHVADSYTTA